MGVRSEPALRFELEDRNEVGRVDERLEIGSLLLSGQFIHSVLNRWRDVERDYSLR
jgi:hypothetical protein